MEGKISQGKYEGHNIIIPWIPLTLKFSFSSINKSQACQDQALEVDLTNESFTHRMLYVALTRGGSPDSLTLYSREGLLTRNALYTEVSAKFICCSCISGIWISTVMKIITCLTNNFSHCMHTTAFFLASQLYHES